MSVRQHSTKEKRNWWNGKPESKVYKVRNMSAIIATVFVFALTAILVVGCRTRIELSDFTVPSMIESYVVGDWYFYKKRHTRPADFVLATIVSDAVVTDKEVGREGDYYIVEEDGRADIMSPELFKEHYVKIRKLK